MYLHSINVFQRPYYFDLADYFYDRILELPGRLVLGEKSLRWFEQPAHLSISLVPYGEDPALAGRFTGVQLNVTPASGLDRYVEAVRETGLKLPDPRDLGDVRVISVPDSSENTLMLLGRDEAPDEPLIDQAVGSVSVFVKDIERARRFYVDRLGLPVRAEPHPGLLVLGESGTALMLYQVPEDNPHTPIGRITGLVFVDSDLAPILERVGDSDGEVLDQTESPPARDDLAPAPTTSPDAATAIAAATIADPDGNTLTVLSEAHLRQREQPATETTSDDSGSDSD